jgi:putative ABC transport system permease protein
MFAGAVVAAFNLIARVVESQRREIGLSMVFGVRPLRIAVRPLLVAAEIALLGALFGIAVGMGIGLAMASVLRDLQPLPQWQTPFLPGVFFAVGLAGFLLPFLATTWPVWRAVRVPPVQAIQAGYRSVKGGGLAPVLSRIRLPGNTFMQMPVRNVVRTPRRSLLTIVGIAAALAALVAFVGLIDSFLGTIDRGRDELRSSSPDRLEATLDRPYAIHSGEVRALAGADAVGAAEPILRLDSLAIKGGDEVALQLEVRALDSTMWRPTITAGERDRETPGIYLTELAASNLGADVGDEITLRHPRLTPAGGFELVETPLPVLGLHPHPFRFVAYMDANHAALFNLAGATNLVQVNSAEGATADDVKRALFEMPGVTSVQGVDEVGQAIEDLLSEFVIVLRVVEGAMLLLALLIAFNSASINMDERAREHATMFAFGVPVRTVLRMAVMENLILGVFATALGFLGGWLLLLLIIAIRIPETIPDIDVPPVISPTTVVITVALGILAVALSPLLTWRRLRRMNVPATLKVFE